MSDLIRRQDAIDAICEHGTDLERRGITVLAVANHKQVTVDLLEKLPSAQPYPTLYGYQIEHLEMIARVMAKENYTPEAVVQILQNAGEIARMVRDEMMEMLKESIERSCKGEANDYHGRI